MMDKKALRQMILNECGCMAREGELPSSFGDVAFFVGLEFPSDTFDEPLFVASFGVFAEDLAVPLT
jgi:hypothetical protein